MPLNAPSSPRAVTQFRVDLEMLGAHVAADLATGSRISFG